VGPANLEFVNTLDLHIGSFLPNVSNHYSEPIIKQNTANTTWTPDLWWVKRNEVWKQAW